MDLGALLRPGGKRIPVLARGFSGTIYTVIDPASGRPCALKVEKIMPGDERRPTSAYSMEATFAEEVANKHPDSFVSMLHHWVEPGCKHVQPQWDDDLPPAVRRNLRRLRDSPVCGVKMWSLVDTDVRKLFDRTPRRGKSAPPPPPPPPGAYRQLFVQLVHALCIMRRNGYSHNDVHQGNVGLRRTGARTVDIDGKPFPTYSGYVVQLIDFGLVSRLTPKKDDTVELFADLFERLARPWWRIADAGRAPSEDWVSESRLATVPPGARAELERALPRGGAGLVPKHRALAINKLYKVLHYEDWQRATMGASFRKPIPPDSAYGELDLFLIVSKHLYNIEGLLKELLS